MRNARHLGFGRHLPHLDARIDDAADIERRLEAFLSQLHARTAAMVAPDVAARYSRRAQTAVLADLLDTLIPDGTLRAEVDRG